MADNPGTDFPNNQWGSRETALAHAAHRFAATRLGSWTLRRLMPLDRALLARTDARYTLLGPIGAPIILLTTTGRSSGLPRTQPLIYLHDGDTLHVIGSNFGLDHHPAWTANLIANPSATVAIAGERIPVIATRVPSEDAGAIFTRFLELSAAYTAYRERTDRELRIFALRRA
ncbi:nitroreductase family deazaflavin-dependent oxidoreductase [Nocardia takedensis]|uniref:nitroreductase family deazaflavin-dependent oxidoreductase n=1 Tax=Nocardia takedensis TaxID=259390 RepID=UPI0002E0353B|nr:nitroreductase family deazaflavin-dependent oxidoreductase [Nocardia takedensis]